MASLIIAREKNIKIDEIVYVEVMFSSNISGENPLHIDFINNVVEPKLNEWGYKFTRLKANSNYVENFNHRVLRSKQYPERIGKKRGFPLSGMCAINRDLKVAPIKKYKKTLGKVTEIIGIAADENRNIKENQISILKQFNITEKEALEICKKNNLLSPVYDLTQRNGCWFCPNCKIKEFAYIKYYHSEYWKELLKLDEDNEKVSRFFKINQTLSEIDSKADLFIKLNYNQIKIDEFLF